MKPSSALLSMPCILSVLGACAPAPPDGPPPAASAAVTRYAPANRPDVRGRAGAVSAGHPLAAQAGMRVLQEGGNAVDAVIAMAGVLAVVRPHMNGVGGDAFGIFLDGETGETAAINASGRAGALASPEFFAAAGAERIPGGGALSVTVPGAVAGWADAHERFGSMDFAALLAPAIGYAREGFPVSSRLARDFEEQGGNLNEAGRALYLPGGAPPPVGGLLANPALAATLEAIARDGGRDFYQGATARRLAAFVAAEGGHLRAEDFAAHRSEWVEPLARDYLGRRFLAMPPNTQGAAQLALMEMSRHHPLGAMEHNSARYLHTLIELKKLAFADRDRWIADPAMAEVPVDRLLDPDYLRGRAARVDPARAMARAEPGFGGPLPPDGATDDAGDTVYAAAVDRRGNAVSWIQSNFAGFGSGLLDGETGVLLHNRGALFTLTEGHPNRAAPGKRPYHTLSPTMALHPDGSLAFALGTPGGDGQTQTVLQVAHNLLLFGMTPQQAVEAPRFRSSGGAAVAVENRMDRAALAGLEALGHRLDVVDGWTATFGGAQMIRRDPLTGTLTTAADPRREAYAIAW